MQIYTLDSEQLGVEVTKIKNIIIEYLYDNDLITYEVFNDLTLNYGIIIKEPSFFSKFWLRKNVLQTPKYVLVKQLTISESNNKSEASKSTLSVVVPLKKDEDKDE